MAIAIAIAIAQPSAVAQTARQAARVDADRIVLALLTPERTGPGDVSVARESSRACLTCEAERTGSLRAVTNR